MIKTCECKNTFQDKRYGYKRRVMNPMGGTETGPHLTGWRCASCKKEWPKTHK